MKTNYWFTFCLIYGLAVSPVHSASATNGTKGTHKASHKKADSTKSKTEATPSAPVAPTIEPGPAEVNQEHVNVRARADVESEVVTRLKRHDIVKVIEEVTLKKSGPGEPSRWAKIEWPADAPVWVFAGFLDRGASEVKVKKLNLRSGPGENYAVVGSLEKGAAIKKLETKGEWWKIEAPAGCAAFVAANLLIPKPAAPEPAPVVAAKPVAPAPLTPAAPRPVPAAPLRPIPAAPVTPAAPALGVSEVPPGVVVGGTPNNPPPPRPVRPIPAFAAGGGTPPPPAPPQPSLSIPSDSQNATAVSKPVVAPVPPPTPTPAAPALTREPGEVDFHPVREESYSKRVVTREGLIRRSFNIQSPTGLTLENLHNGRTMNYLYSTSTNLNLSVYRGRVVTVTGEEALDERWPNVPVLRVETLQTAP